ncbi:uncharacterized protein [Drosophila pseudoobscura]|uniref:Uncharacterized protein n=1 Tax=Drosophila pseudoobscura pseudoobscura TaxID=46245 RepID=A0A6I8UMY1_DROPS|nr:uncharacterized protein LOC4800920 [Drosophila pseudoobscura]
MRPPPGSGQHANSSLTIYALMWLLLSITMSGGAGLQAAQGLPLQHGRGNYQDTGLDTESLAGLTGYTRNYYGTSGGSDDLARATARAVTYGNYAPPQAWSGFVPHSQAGPRGDIDFVINTGNYETGPGPGPGAYQSYGYQSPTPRVATPYGHYHFEQISNYRDETGEQEDHESSAYARIKERPTWSNPVKRQQAEAQYRQGEEGEGRGQQEVRERQQEPREVRDRHQDPRDRHQEPRERHQDPRDRHQDPRELRNLYHDNPDQQLLYSHTDLHLTDLPKARDFLPPITSSVHHTPSSSQALAGVPLSKHIETIRQVAVPHYQKQLVPYKQTLQLQVPRTVIAAVPKPVAIKVPVTRTVAVPQLQEVKIPIERIQPVAVERPMPFVVERRVPYRVEKAVATPVYYPYPVKVPVVRTVVHKQQPQHHHYHHPGGWGTNHLLG